MWFKFNDFTKYQNINLDDLHGFVLPHAGTEFTGDILSHTIRFKPTKKFNKIVILYYPSKKKENVKEDRKKYYHEYYVVWKTMLLALVWWNIKQPVEFVGVNILNEHIPNLDIDKTFFVISADFSHGLSLNNAIHIENCAAHALMQQELNHRCARVIDNSKTFKIFNREILNTQDWDFQWVGRTRSTGISNGVGYLSFLLREIPNVYKEHIDGYFITAYDNRMQQRECLGKIFSGESGKWTQRGENNFLKQVLHAAETTSRLTGGRGLGVPITNYTIAYLYREKYKQSFIRGWHGISYGSFYLPDVLLENTFDNGKWITSDDVLWPPENDFNISETLEKLKEKSGDNINNDNKKIILYRTKVLHEFI
jgi:hypothetical protein